MDEIPVFVSFLFTATLGLIAALSWTAHREPQAEGDASTSSAAPAKPKRFAFLIAIIAFAVWFFSAPYSHTVGILGFVGAYGGYLLAWSFPSGMMIGQYGRVIEKKRDPFGYRLGQVLLALNLVWFAVVGFIWSGMMR